MAAPNFLVKGGFAGGSFQVDTMNVAAGAVGSITAGDMVTVTSGVAAKSADAAATNAGQFGIAVSTSTDTVGVAGTVDVAYDTKGLVVQGKANVPGSLAASKLYYQARLAVSGAVQTINESAAGKITIKSYDNTTSGNTVAYLPWSLA